MASLSKAHRLILTTAAERADGALLPLPDELVVRGRARRLMLQGLIKRGLVVERPAQDDQPAWAQGDGEPSIALEITAQGRALVGSTARAPAGHDDRPLEPAGPRADAEAPVASAARPTVRPGTKQALLVDLLRRHGGATAADIQAATGWQPHTARAAITGLRKKSFSVTSTRRSDGARAYCLLPQDIDHGEGMA